MEKSVVELWEKHHDLILRAVFPLQEFSPATFWTVRKVNNWIQSHFERSVFFNKSLELCSCVSCEYCTESTLTDSKVNRNTVLPHTTFWSNEYKYSQKNYTVTLYPKLKSHKGEKNKLFMAN